MPSDISKVKYIIQDSHKTRCKGCSTPAQLLCPEDLEEQSLPWFYICWRCKTVAQVGVGEVPYEV